MSSNGDPAETLITLKNVGKVYHLFDRPIDRLKYSLFWRFGKTYGSEFWALREITLDVRKGDSVGIMGRNGSGKSTLLQIMAGVLQPTEGEVNVKGRVSALLELGSGFNPEFTGRQNVYMSGAILGISKKEMDERFDDIAAFADIGVFIDQPVKLYSSGMFARLAFSVAVSVDPDILVVDEILAVGDYDFQQKCALRMRQMREDGLTLLYVSHSTEAIRDICNRGLFLNQGHLMYWGTAEDAADRYMQFIRERKWMSPEQKSQLPDAPAIDLTNLSAKFRYGSGQARVTRVEISDENDQPTGQFYIGEQIRLHIYFVALADVQNFSANFAIRDNLGINVMGTNLFDERYSVPDLRKGENGHVVFKFKNQLRHGNYGVLVSLNSVSDPDYLDNVELDMVGNAVIFQVIHDPRRPVWYKFHCPVEIEYSTSEKAEIDRLNTVNQGETANADH